MGGCGGGGSGSGGSGGAAIIQILGLDRVAGATSATREAARHAAASARECGTGDRVMGPHGAAVGGGGGAEKGASAAVLAVEEEVSVQSEGINNGHGLAQVEMTGRQNND